MHRPTRTRRLSLAAMVSLLAFVVLAAVGVRSYWTWDEWDLNWRKYGDVITVNRGSVTFRHFVSIIADTPVFGVTGHASGDVRPEYISYEPGSIFGLVVRSEHLEAPFNYERFIIRIPLWFPLLLLLIAPICWLIARPANAPAFPVVNTVQEG